MSYVVGQTIPQQWTVYDQDNNPLTGMLSPADVTLALFRTSGAAVVASGEAISWFEIGSTGEYYASFTPAQTGVYTLKIREIDPSTQLRLGSFSYEVAAAGAVFTPSPSNAYCAQSDVERWTQWPFSVTSKPTINQVLAFMQARASELTAICAGEGFAVTPQTVVSGSIEQDILREINAISAAADAIAAKLMQEGPSQSDRVEVLLTEYDRRLATLREHLQRSAAGNRSIRTHISSGEVTLRDEPQIVDSGFADNMTMDTEF